MRLYENWPQVLKPFKRLVEKLFIHWHAGIGRGHFFIADICDLITEHDRLLTFCLLHCAIVCPPPRMARRLRHGRVLPVAIRRLTPYIEPLEGYAMPTRNKNANR